MLVQMRLILNAIASSAKLILCLLDLMFAHGWHSNSTARFHHPARFFYNYPIKFGQESWCNFRWPADFQRPHCKNCSILQVCTTQHQKDQALPYTACSTTSCPGPCHIYTGLLQCSSSWTSIMLNQTFTDDSVCSGKTGLLWTQKSPCFTSLYLLGLAPGCSLHQVQDTDACIYNSHRLSTRLLPLTDDNLHPFQKSKICEWAMPHGANTERHKITLQNVFIHHSWLMEWTSHHHPEYWILTIFKQHLKTHLFHHHYI